MSNPAHDPLCDWKPCTCPLDYDVPERGHMIGCPEDDCECEIIAKVRADERSMCAGAGQNHNENIRNRACRPGLVVGHRWENEDMDHDPLCIWPKLPPKEIAAMQDCAVCVLIAKADERGATRALDKARQAVEDVPWGISYGKSLHISQSKAIDAIDALKPA